MRTRVTEPRTGERLRLEALLEHTELNLHRLDRGLQLLLPLLLLIKPPVGEISCCLGCSRGVSRLRG